MGECLLIYVYVLCCVRACMCAHLSVPWAKIFLCVCVGKNACLCVHVHICERARLFVCQYVCACVCICVIVRY